MNAAASQALDQFLAHLAARNLSRHTISAYRRDLHAVVQWCDAHQVGEWAQFDRVAVRECIAQRHRRGLSARSLRRNLAAIRALYRWLQRNGYTGNDPAQDVPLPKVARDLPTTLDADQMAYLLHAQPDDDIGIRDSAMMELFYSCGVRLSELVALDIDAFEGDGMLRVLKAKGAQQRVVPVGRLARKAVSRWRGVRQRWARDDEPALFISKRGTRLTPRAVQLRVKHWARERGAAANVHPHLLRHSCASHVLESSGDLRAVQELLGHANLATTQIYTHLDFQHLARIYDDAHPRAKKNHD